MAVRVAISQPLFQSPTAAAMEVAPLQCSWRNLSQVPVGFQTWSSLPNARQSFSYKVTNRIGTLQKSMIGGALASREKRPSFQKRNSFIGNWTRLGIPPAEKAFRMRDNARTGNVQASLSDILHNEVLITTAAACVLCQGLKPFAAVAEGKPLNWKLVFKSGGMPSSHTSTVTALATAVGLERGLDDDLFAICVVLASIVMYDAQGVRYAVGKQAEVLNSIIIPEIPNPPPSMVDLAEQREAPQAEQMLEDQTNEQAYSSQTGPSRSGVLVSTGKMWEETEAGTSGSEGDRWQGRIGSERSARRRGGSSRRVTGMLEDALSAPEGAAWINSLDGDGRDGRLGGSSTFYSPLDGAVSNSFEKEEGASEKGKQEQRQAGVSMEKAAQREGYPKAWRHVPLKEAVGHSKVEVAVGGVAGVVLAFLFHATVFGSHL